MFALALLSLAAIAWAAAVSAAEALRWAFVTGVLTATLDVVLARKFATPPS